MDVVDTIKNRREAREGNSKIFAEEGEMAFREYESENVRYQSIMLLLQLVGNY